MAHEYIRLWIIRSALTNDLSRVREQGRKQTRANSSCALTTIVLVVTDVLARYRQVVIAKAAKWIDVIHLGLGIYIMET